MTDPPWPGVLPPSATYRVQFGPGFTFDDAAAIVRYLAALGVSHLHCSPVQQAATAEQASYRIADHSRLDESLGGPGGYQRLSEALSAAGLSQLLDIAPHRLTLAGRESAWWWDVLEHGPASRYASYFDIDASPPDGHLAATVIMPVLADRYGRVLDAGELRLRREGGAFTVTYQEIEAPISLPALGDLLTSAADAAGSAELRAVATNLGNLSRAIRAGPAQARERRLAIGELRGRLAVLCEREADLAQAIDAEIEAVNSDADRLDELLARQNYRLAYLGMAAEEPAGRRFLGVGSLAILRVDRPEVFDDVHELPLRLVRQGSVSGLRVDHVDGLADPEGYLTRLRTAAGDAIYIVADKTLGPDEKLPGSWPVAGTTGYDFLNLAGELFVDQDGRQPILDGYASFTGQDADLAEITRAAKLQVMAEELDAEVERLTWQLAGICEHRRRQRDYTRRELRAALEELLAAFAVCRCYPRPGQDVTLADRAKVAAAVTAARQRRQDLDAELFDFIGGLLLLRQGEAGEAEFAVGFAQVSTPVMTKGTEGIAFSRYLPLACLNEVGGDPARFGGDLPDFHDAMRYAALHWPDTMLTLSTHDTKRSGDVRARMSVLSELPHAWNAAIRQWSEHNARYKKRAGKHGSRNWPDRVTEYLLYQSMVGAWPVQADRLRRYLIAAVRDARLHTSWTDPQAGYEDALAGFVAAVLSDAEFVAAVATFLARHSIVARGRLNSLASTALLLTCPGVPDLYQGTEIWDLSLADPDGRQPVDFAARGELLAELAGAGPQQAFARDDAGGTKLWLISRLLNHRRSNPHCYSRLSGYEPLEVSGPGAGRFVAFARSAGLVVVVPRLATSAADPWTGTSVGLPPGRWASVLTGEAHQGGQAAAAALLRFFPVQVLARED